MSQSRRMGGRARFYHDIQLRGPVPSGLIHDPAVPGHEAPALYAAALEWSSQGDLAPQTPQGADVLQSFGWLPVLAAGGDEGAQAIRRLTEFWLDQYGRFVPSAWRPAVTAIRLTRMLHHSAALTAWADGPLRERIYDSMARQARHLSRGLRGSKNDQQLRVVLARTLASLCLPEDRQIGAPVTPQLARTVDRLAKGQLPRSWRDPARAIEDAHALRQVADGFRARRLSGPSEMDEAIRVARLFVGGFCTDGKSMVRLPGTQRPDIGALQSLSPVCRDEAESLLAPMGFAAMRQGNTLVGLDLGISSDFHGAGAIAVTTGHTPLIVNCGVPSMLATGLVDRMGAWRAALSTPAAASAFDTEALRPADSIAADTPEGPVRRVSLDTADGPITRTVRLGIGGKEVDVEDAVSSSPLNYRFHLPRAAYAKADGNSVELTYRGGLSAVFEISGADIAVEESVSAWQDGQIDKTLQLVVQATAPVVRWRLHWS